VILASVIERLKRSPEWQFLAVFRKADGRLTAAWWSLVALRGLLPAAFAIAMGLLVGAIQGDRGLGGPLIVVGIVFVAMNALGPVHGTVGSLLGAKSGAWLHDRLMEASVSPPGLAHLERPDLGDDLAKGREFDQGIVAPPLEAALPFVATGFAEIIAGLAQASILTAYRWWAGLVLAGAWASTHVLLKESAMWKIYDDESVVTQRRHVDYAYRLSVEALGAKEIRLFGLADWAVERFIRIRRGLTDALYRQRALRQRPLRWSVLTVFAGNALVFGFLARDAARGSIEMAALVVFAQAAIGVTYLAFGEFDWWFRGSAQPIPMVLGLAEKMREAGALPGGEGRSEGLPSREIRFEGVHFAYPTTGVSVLEGFDLTIPAGTSLAIVGPNGAGKTTLAKLLCRLYDPQRGSVSADGVDLRSLDVEAWRKRIAAVFQDFVRFELPMRDNVAPNGASDDEVRRALEQAGAADLAEIDTILSRAYENGTDLSGGQWQRVALARALCAVQLGAGVILLDEPTAQLDVRGESEIFDRILDATRGRTTILISHRFSTVRHAERICVLEHGRVVELGSHEELMALGGRYRTMFDLQASRFYEEVEEVDA
jgi:ABC-type transport system involved in cytochrome bd biosynthesis fused ATPase/permease subunit